MKQIGKGSFSTVYLKPNGKVLLKSIDRVKEAMAYGFFPNSNLFPKIKHVDTGDTFCFYEMKYYPKVSSLKGNLTPRQWKLYKALREIFSSLCGYDANDGYDILIRAFEKLPAQFKREKGIIQEALDGLSNYGTDIAFEISPRNVAVSNGKLVLLDCFFFINDLKKIRKSR